MTEPTAPADQDQAETKTKHPGGRPTKYRPEFVEQARKLAALGAIDREVADFFGVDDATVYRWKHSHPEFCDALKVGKGAADARVEQSLYRRALGYEHEAVKIAVNADGKVTEVPYVERYPPDTTAAIFWLKNRKPEEWRDVKAQEISGPGGGAVRSEIDVSNLTPEQLKALASVRLPTDA